MNQLGHFHHVLLVVILLQAALTSESFSIPTKTKTSLVHKSPMTTMPTPAFASTFGSRSSNANDKFIQSAKATSYHHKAAVSPLFNAVLDQNDNNNNDPTPTYGGLLGKLTGLSLTAIRRSLRTTTGLSLTATRTALRGLTGVSVTASMKKLFGVLPPGLRYFVQPFFIMYYTPLMIIKYVIGSTKTSKDEAYAAHELIIEGWKDAIRATEEVQDSWPLHVTDDGQIESLTPQSIPITDAIVESLDIASSVQDQGKGKL